MTETKVKKSDAELFEDIIEILDDLANRAVGVDVKIAALKVDHANAYPKKSPETGDNKPAK